MDLKKYKKMVLDTERLTLVPLSQKHLDFIYKNTKNKNVTRYTEIGGAKKHPSKEDLKRYITRMVKHKQALFFIILLKENNKPVGSVGLNKINLEHKTCTTFSWLQEDFWRNGFAFEAKVKLLKFAFTKLRLNKIETSCDYENTNVMKHLTSLGFKKEGVLRESFKVESQFRDSILFGLLKKEFRY